METPFSTSLSMFLVLFYFREIEKEVVGGVFFWKFSSAAVEYFANPSGLYLIRRQYY